MPDPLVQTVTIAADSVRPRDVVTVGGIPHVVADVRELAGRRKRLEFEDGNAYVVGRSVHIEVTRVYVPANAVVRRRSAVGVPRRERRIVVPEEHHDRAIAARQWPHSSSAARRPPAR
ncbi:hypothetical protein ACFU99_18530 [Streptomyces sp. NPDC057654]|uniref:hypothetical protein n=1 Tax=Streptomyces sp. NPDC057654 TaxID=3346196 RepID=UPI00368E4F6B